uniref:Protein FLX-like 2 n=1 Tax=Cannabis sativa TaxID=3483 RepID=A0A803QKF6_CANSA
MGSKGRMPPSHHRRPLPGPGMGHPEQFGRGMHPPPGGFPHFDMMPPPEVMEHKLAAQHIEMQRLVTENQRLASTHGTLRQELAGAQHELQMLHGQIGAVKAEREQRMRNMMEKISKMEAELKAAEPLKSELQKARAEAQSLVAARQELISKAQQLSQDLQIAHSDVQQIPALMAELDSLRQEYQHCRATYDCEKKLYNDHLESLQLMETNYMTMAREVEKLQGELMMNPTYADRRPGAPYGITPGTNDNEASGHPVGQNAYEDGYGASQQSHNVVQVMPGYDASRGPGYDSAGVPAYDPQRGHGYEAQVQRGGNYDGQRGSGYDAHRPGYDMQRGPVYNVQRGGPGYDPSKVSGGYDPQSRGGLAPQGHIAPTNQAPYGSSTPPAAAHGGNPVRR